MTILDWLIQRYPTAKRQTLRRMLQEGRVRIGSMVIRSAKHALSPDDQPAVAERPVERPVASSLNIIYEDADILIVNKPPDLLTSTVRDERRPTLLARVRDYYARDRRVRVGVIHRLDREAAGLLVFSKNDLAYESLKRQFFHHDVQRVYLAVVHGAPQPLAGRIESKLVEYADGTVHPTLHRMRGQNAVTDYQTLKSTDHVSLLRVTLHTGRKHQIRVHLAQQNVPIVGDRVYGPQPAIASRLMLMAVRLGITHPRTDKPMTFEIPPDPAMTALLI